jgi:hypothetical protein
MLAGMRLELRFQAVPVEAMRAFLEPLGYELDWDPEADGVGFLWRKPPLSGSGVRGLHVPEGDEALLVLETDAEASPADACMQDVTARLLAERFDGVSVWCQTTGRAEYAGGQSAEPPAPGSDLPRWYT